MKKLLDEFHQSIEDLKEALELLKIKLLEFDINGDKLQSNSDESKLKLNKTDESTI
jgi:hypothetical protein